MINFIAVIISVLAFGTYFYLAFQSRLLHKGFIFITSGLFLSLVLHAMAEFLESRGSISTHTLVIIMPILVSVGTALLTLGGIYIFYYVITPLKTMMSTISLLKQGEDHSVRFKSKFIGQQNEINELAQALDGLLEELKHAQEQLFLSDKMASIGQLAAGIAHEINNPVGFISSNMEIFQDYIRKYTMILKIIDKLKRQVEDGDLVKARLTIDELNKFKEENNLDYVMNDVNPLLDQTAAGIRRINKIVHDLKTFTRADKSDKTQTVKIEEIIEGILSIVNNELKYKAALNKYYGKTSAISCDIHKIGQVLINILVNAAQAIEGSGTISIKTYQQDKYVCVDIADTGKGIPPENIKKIFDPFFTTKPVGQGTGLGLSISYEIIKNHGGKIDVQSKVGEGTTFTIFLPAQ